MKCTKTFYETFPSNLNLGTARRIQYTLNNTDVSGYNPPPCFHDWPPTTDSTGAPWKWTICCLHRNFFKVLFLLGQRPHPVGYAWAWMIERKEDKFLGSKGLGNPVFESILGS